MGSGQKEPVFELQVVSYRNEGERIRVQNRRACGKAVQYLPFRRLPGAQDCEESERPARSALELLVLYRDYAVVNRVKPVVSMSR